MASTTAAVPLVIRASFLFSGMFGIRLEGLKDQNGHPITIQSAMPLNFTVPAVVMNQSLQPHVNRTDQIRCIENCKRMEYNKRQPSTLLPNATHPTNESNANVQGNSGVIPVSPQVAFEMLAVVSSPSTTTTMPPPLGKPCGPGRCTREEICVSWMKQRNHHHRSNARASRRESPTMVHECLPNDGIHWTKMNPSGAKLCDRGKTHSIILKQSHKYCSDNKLEPNQKSHETCEIAWMYTCINEKDSPHSCSLRECPYKGACIEIKTCDLRGICFVEAVCTPEFLIPANLRKKTGK